MRRIAFGFLTGLLVGFPGGSPAVVSGEGPRRERDRLEKNTWAFEKLTRPELPRVKNQEWARSALDLFVLSKLEEQELAPAPPADRATLLRRASLDLLGLPPEPGELLQFLEDDSSDAFEKAVDRLLASPRLGERWGRHWLDVARFSESHGYEYDKIRDHAWRYRDYVVDSLNEDRPYLRFLKEQIAGDVLEPVSLEGVVATGFLTAGPWDEVGNRQQSLVMRARVREEQLEDIIAVVSHSFLGLTVNCARCHDHKFDPISIEDYYRMKAVFEGVRYGDRPVLAPVEAKKHREAVVLLEQELKEVAAQIKSLNQTPRERAGERKEEETLLSRQAAAREALKALKNIPHVYAVNSGKPPPTHVLLRGSVEEKGERVGPGGLSAIMAGAGDLGLPLEASEGLRRLKFAEWVAGDASPLTARVMANRVWHYHFGRGIVPTPSDFGQNGEPPSHPLLLNWLACEFAAGGWSIKNLHRIILLSSTYRQSARFRREAAAVDSPNRLLWRFTPRRLEGEVVRDSILWASGSINYKMGGPGFRPFTVKVFGSHLYTLTDPIGPEFNRRTIYRHVVNSARDPLLEAMDCPDPSVKTPHRAITTTPIQSLALMNDTFVLRRSEEFARRVEREAGTSPSARVVLSHRLALGRKPTPEELERGKVFLEKHGLSNLAWVLFNSSEFLYLR